MGSINKRLIIRNTAFVFTRIFTSFVVGFISSRLVLQSLGASDFGLYSVVGGFVMLFLFMSDSMTQTTTRFLSYEKGKVDGDMNRVFNISNVLHIIMALFVFIVLEIIGLWYIINHLNVAPDRLYDALFVFHISAAVAVVSITNVPYRSMFIANEKFHIIAAIDFTNSIIKLLIAVSLIYYSGNTLRYYAVCMSTSTILAYVAYHYLCRKYWSESIKWKLVKRISDYKHQLCFNNWNLLGSASEVLQSQGAHILINSFFGTIANAAYAVSRSIHTCVVGWSRSFNNVSEPQIIKAQGENNLTDAYHLVCTTNRIALLVMMPFYFSVSVKLVYLLRLWLGYSVPNGTLEFCQYFLLVSIIATSASGLSSYINGFGQIKWFNIWKSICYVLSLIVGFVAYSMGFPPYSIMLCFFFSEVLHRIMQLTLLKKMSDFSILRFIKETWVRPIIVFTLLFIVMWLLNSYIVDTVKWNLFCIALMFLISVLAIIYIGLLPNERRKIMALLNF